MKKQLLFFTISLVFLSLSSFGQSLAPNACDLNLTNNLASVNSQCTVEFADLVIPTITDSCGNTVVPTTDGSIFPISATGTTTIIWEYVNELGGIETQFQNINILDFTPPVVDVAILPNFHSQCAVQQADLPIPTATDNCSGIVTVSNDGVFPITVSTLIIWTFTDATGNESYQTQDIYINDFTEPVPDVAVLGNIHSPCQVLQTDVPVPTATDNCIGLVTVSSDAVFPINTTTLITWTYTDANGNESFQTQDIYIDDFTEPVPDVAILPNVHAACQVAETDLIVPTATDNCPNSIIVTNDATFPIVTSTLITWTYTDANGNSSYQTQDIYIDDIVSPVPDVAVLADVISPCTLLEADLIAPTATDNCTAVVVVTNDGVFPITASTIITWTFKDNSGNVNSQTQNVNIINDTIVPTPDAPSLADITAECEVLEADVTIPTATDNCSGIVTVSNDATFPITATTTITWTYTDANGNSETQTQNVIVDDVTAPTPDALTLSDITAECEVLEVDVTIPTATDNCTGIVTVSSDATFPITATTTITWTYTDINGNSATQSQNVVINDTTAPTPDALSLADITAECEVLEVDVTIPTATDNCSGTVSVSNDATFPITATTTINWTYTDSNGNSATQSQNVVINDTTAPTPDVLSLADITAECEVLEVDVTIPTATDNCSGTVSVSNDATFPITATTTITWTYTDLNGNSATQTQNVVIDDVTAPTPDALTLADITAECEVLEADVTIPTATDNCTGIVTVSSDAIFPITATTTITWTYTDANGNSATQSQNVVINDTTAPTPDALSLADITAECEVLEVDVTIPTATDNCTGIVTVSNDATFPITATTTINWTYTDSNGNSATQSQNVVINDTTAPTPDALSLADITAECEVLEVDVTIPTATDNCSGTVSVSNDATFPITATTTITWTYTDLNGNSATQTQNVVINDTTAPTPDAPSLADITAECEVLEADVTIPTATDNCTGIVTVSSDAIFPITATTTITWTYTDANGNSATQSQNVIIDDVTAPTPDALSLADIMAQCEVLEVDVMIPTATDNCTGIVTVSSDATFPITATTTITWTYTDANGNSATQTQNIIIDDVTAPTPDALSLADITAQCEVLEVDVMIPTATDNCTAIVTVSNDATFPIMATTTITWTYTDANGNSATQSQNVIVNDTTAPTPDALSLADITAECEVLEVDVTIPTATDNCSGTVSVSNDATFPITATTTITWTYTDLNGNSATQTQNVVIDDVTAPTPDAPSLADITVECEVLEADVTIPTATDNCTGIVTVSSDAIFPITATTTITWTYTDANGNSATQSQNVIVNDTTAPTPDALSLADITAQCQVLEADVTMPTATDNCSSVTITNDAVFPITAQGVTTITWTYSDANGNSTTQTQDVLIGDTTAPTVTLTDITVSVNVSGIVTIAAAQLENGTANDNCGVASMTVSPNAFTCAQLGDHVVTVTVIDIHGNSTSEVATVTVTDPTDFCGALAVGQNVKSEFVIYPNPTADIVYVENGSAQGIHSIKLYALTGQLILTQSYKQITERYSVSLSALPQGTYLLKLETAEGTLTKRIVKNKQ